MKIILSEITSTILADKILRYLNDKFVLETCGTPDSMIINQISEIINNEINKSISEFNDMGLII